MGIVGSPDIFQAKISKLMVALEFMRTYLNDLQCITKASLNDHIDHLRLILTMLQEAGLLVNAPNQNAAFLRQNTLGVSSHELV